MPRRSARERILEASVILFAERGYRHTTTKMIADWAGVNEVTLFRHFGTKEGIVKGIIQSRSSSQGEVRHVLDENSTGDLYEDLLKVARIQYKYLSANLKLLVTLVQESPPESDLASSISVLPRSIKDIIVAYFQRMQASGKMRPVDPEEAAVVFMTPTFGFTFMKGFFGNAVTSLTAEEHVVTSVRNFVDAVRM